ncbi:uncharacterized protein G2W53_016625 [Senna tora]|uniref:Uncharacterized protein n=1 Tax=Senna tora TaxID=362788 RepID=A0A834TQZ6_9FABA|nr:uncharacterized protein G2W53_016625 [Senna tora]
MAPPIFSLHVGVRLSLQFSAESVSRSAILTGVRLWYSRQSERRRLYQMLRKDSESNAGILTLVSEWMRIEEQGSTPIFSR